MQNQPHDDTLRWLVGIALPSFVLGVGWLVKHLLGRKAEVVQLGLFEAQTDEIRAKIRRDDESAAVANLKTAADVLRADVGRLRDERDASDVRVGQLLIERQELKDELKHVTGLLKAAEEQLGLKVRHDEN